MSLSSGSVCVAMDGLLLSVTKPGAADIRHRVRSAEVRL